MTRSHILVLSAISVLILATVIVCFWALNNYEVLNKGQILPYTDGFVYEILIAGKYSIYVEPEIRLRPDVFNATLLVGAAYISLTFAAIVFRFERPDLSEQLFFFLMMSIGMFYLSADELIGIHESIGHNMQFLMMLPGVERPDDLILASYGLFCLVFLFRFRGVLYRFKRSAKYFGLAFLFFVVAAIGDLAALGIEEISEVVSGAFVLAGVISCGITATENAVYGSGGKSES